jgi:hypothetical protein
MQGGLLAPVLPRLSWWGKDSYALVAHRRVASTRRGGGRVFLCMREHDRYASCVSRLLHLSVGLMLRAPPIVTHSDGPTYLTDHRRLEALLVSNDR